jgi:hypothetical protein
MKNTTVTLSREFEREDRYVVIKRSDLETIPNRPVVHEFLAALAEVSAHSCRIPQRRFLVIESDWPEYEPTWAAIERRMTGAALAEPVPPAGGALEVFNMRNVMTCCESASTFHLVAGTSNWCATLAIQLNKVVHAHVNRPQAEVEVLAVLDRHAEGGVTFSQDALSYAYHGTELVDREVVTRLQAEVEQWKGSRNDLIKGNDELHSQIADLQSELTKARELLGRVYDADLAARHHQPYNVTKVIDDVENFLAHQSAPAEKGGE